MRNHIQPLIQTCISLGVASTLEQLGIHSGEMSMRKARQTYGKWFTDAVMRERIKPCRIEDGRAGTKFFRVVEILSLMAEDRAKQAELL